MTRVDDIDRAETDARSGHHTAPEPLRATASGPLSGEISPPGDKSISHRALMLAALSVGQTRIQGLLDSDDIAATARALMACGVAVERRGAGEWLVEGCGIHGLAQPDDILDMGNSGTSARLFAGIAAAHPFAIHVTGDASLRRRPMGRVMEPLRMMGAQFVGAGGDHLPMTIIGADPLLSIEYIVPVPSAQVKSAVILAALHAKGRSTIVEPRATRDHTEAMLRHFGATIEITELSELIDPKAPMAGGRRIEVEGQQELIGSDLTVPGDPSSAAFAVAAAAVCPGSDVRILGIGRNPMRTGFYQVLERMGAALTWTNERLEGGEPVADLDVSYQQLTGIEVPSDLAPSMIDEFPILSVVAAFADGPTKMRGVGELRVKESDRLAGIETGLKACGVKVDISGDDLTVHGSGVPPLGGATIASHLDHRLAMSFLVLGLAAERPVVVDDARPIATSYPNFVADMGRLGANIQVHS